MRVILLSYTPEPERLVATAARVCYSPDRADAIMEKITAEKMKKRIRECVEKGHHSVLEHANFTFSIEDISRVTSHQLVRHRLASYSQQSQRYVKLGEDNEYAIPQRIREDEDLKRKFEEIIDKARKFYQEAIGKGIPCEDARYALPSAFNTRIIVTMNARELLHFFNLRCCKKAQWEIRKLAYAMLREVMKIAPTIFEDAGPACFSGECPQQDEKCFEKMSRVREKKSEEGE